MQTAEHEALIEETKRTPGRHPVDGSRITIAGHGRRTGPNQKLLIASVVEG